MAVAIGSDGATVDVDLHANVPGLRSLYPYLDRVWIQWIEERGWDGPPGVASTYPPKLPTTTSPRWRRQGVPPASSLPIVREDVLDPLHIGQAILTCYYAIDSLRHPDWAAAMARAVNDWLANEWLAADDSLYGTIVVPARDPAAAVSEIKRVACNPRFVQVLLPVRSDRLYGQRIWHPVLRACAEAGLVVGIHWGGTTEEAPSTSGFPSWYVEEYSAEVQTFAAQLISLVAEGVFKSFPELKVSCLESGFAWVPWWGWRLNKEWRGLRREIPWVDQLPFDVLRSHVRFSTAPIDAGPAEEMAKIVEWLGEENLLMYSAGYPHGYRDEIGDLLSLLSPEHQELVMHGTARAWYRLPDKTSMHATASGNARREK